VDIQVCPFTELEIRTTEVVLAHEIAAMGRLPWRITLNPMEMQAEFRKMCLERLAGKLPPEAITYPPTAGDRAMAIAEGQDRGDMRTSYWDANKLG
jgi:hypothetical protein